MLLDRLLGPARLAAVFAPAGSGKTTAIREWLARNDIQPDTPGVLVVDDWHRAAPRPDVGAALEQGRRVILAGRGVPPPEFWEVLGRGQGVLVGFADLLLPRERIEQAARERGIAPDADLVDGLLAETGGWAAPVVLALDAAATEPASTDRLLLAARQYLRAEVLAPLPAADRSRCARLALLDAVDDDAAAAILGEDTPPIPDAARALLLPAADGEQVFPPILARLLRHDIPDPAAAATVHLRAGRYHESRGDWDRALTHTLRAGPDRAVRQLKRMLAVLEPQGRSEEALRWFRRLPESTRIRPDSLLGLGLALVQARLPREAAQLLDQADPAVWDRPDQVAELGMIRAMVHRLLFEHDAAVAAAEHARTLLDGARTAPGRLAFLRVMTVEQLREIAWWRGDHAEVRRLALDSHRDLLRAEHRLSLVHATAVTALAAADSGDIARARAQAAVTLRTAEQCGFRDTHVVAEAHLALGLIALEQGEPGRAVTELRRAHALAADSMFPTTARRVELTLAPALAETGQADEAGQLLTDLGDHARRTGDPILAARLLAAAAQVHRHAGDADTARAQYARLATVRTPPDVVRQRALLACALGAERDLPALLPLLAPEPADEVVAALVRARLGDVASLADGLRRAERIELRRIVLELLRGHRHLLGDGVADLVTGPGPRYVRGLAAALAESAPARVLLSARETQIARLLPTRTTQTGIAAELYISANTMKTHIRHIYQKLGVQTRDEAVARLTELGIVPG